MSFAIRGESRLSTRSNIANVASVWPWLSVVCSSSGSSVVLPRISSSVNVASRSVETMICVPNVECWSETWV